MVVSKIFKAAIDYRAVLFTFIMEFMDEHNTGCWIESRWKQKFPQRGGHFSVACRELYLSEVSFFLGRIRVDPSQKHLRIPVHVRCRIMKYFHTYG